jgi:hypothetical protein
VPAVGVGQHLRTGHPVSIESDTVVVHVVSAVSDRGAVGVDAVEYGVFPAGGFTDAARDPTGLERVGELLSLTAGVVAYVAPATPASLGRNVVWRYWFVASVVGILVNIAAALLVTTDIAGGDPLEETAPMEFGVILPWLVIYAGGYLLPAAYNRTSGALNSAERSIYGAAGVVSLALAVVLATVPTAYPVMVLALAGLSLVPLLTLRYRGT